MQQWKCSSTRNFPKNFSICPASIRGGAREISEGVRSGDCSASGDLGRRSNLKAISKAQTGKHLCLWICSVFAIPMPNPSLFPGFFKGEKKGFLCRRPTPYPKWEIRKRWLERLYTLVVKVPHASFRSILLTFLSWGKFLKVVAQS